MYQDLKEVYEELEKIFGAKAVAKIYSHVCSLANALEDMTKSRDKWKDEALKK